MCVYFQSDLNESTSFTQRAPTSATSALGALECPTFFRINQKFHTNKHMLETPPHARALNCRVLMALMEFFTLVCKHFTDYCSLLSKTCQTTKLHVIVRLLVTVCSLKSRERPSSVGEYMELTGLYISASKAIRGRHAPCEPSGGNISVHVVTRRFVLKTLTVATTHRTS